MAYIGSKGRCGAALLFICATGLCGSTAPAQAQIWSWFFRAPATAPAPPPPAGAPSAVPVKRIKAITPGKGVKAPPAPPAVLHETSAEDVRRTLDATREYRTIAQRLSVEAALQFDPTLRRGDIAVTSTGLQVFNGARANFHPAGDFVPLARSKLALRSDLKAIQTAGRYDLPSVATKTAFVDVLTVRPLRRIEEVRSRDLTRQGFQVINIPKMR